MVAQRQPAIESTELTAVPYDDPQPIRLPPDWALTDERFLEIAQLNPDQLLERTADGRLQLMAWPERLSERTTTLISAFIALWHLSVGGEARGEGGGYIFSDGPAMAPDASWVSPEQLERGRIEKGQFYFAPAFVVEVRSPSQSIPEQQTRMEEWIGRGVRLGWLIDPYERRVWIYRANGEVEELDNPSELSGEDVCAGLTIDMARVWSDT